MDEEKVPNRKKILSDSNTDSPREEYIKIKIKPKNKENRNIRKNNIFKNLKDNNDKLQEKMKLLNSKKKLINRKIYKSANNINNNNNSILISQYKLINNTHSSGRNQTIYDNQYETPFLRKYILKLYKDDSVNKGNNGNSTLGIKYNSINNSLSKNSKNDYYNEYEFDYNLKDINMETEIKEMNNNMKNDLFFKNNQNSGKKIEKKIIFIKKYNTLNNENNHKQKLVIKQLNNAKKNYVEDRSIYNNKKDNIRNKKNISSDLDLKIYNTSKKIRTKNFENFDISNNTSNNISNNKSINKSYKNKTVLQKTNLIKNVINSNNYLKKKKIHKINLSPIIPQRIDKYFFKINDGYFSDNEFYKSKINLENTKIKNYRSSLDLFDTKNIYQKLLNKKIKVYHTFNNSSINLNILKNLYQKDNKNNCNKNKGFKSYNINSSDELNLVCLICNKTAVKPLRCPKCSKIFCEKCIKNKKIKNKFCSNCNTYIRDIYTYIPVIIKDINKENNSRNKKIKNNYNKITIRKFKNKSIENNNKNKANNNSAHKSKKNYKLNIGLKESNLRDINNSISNNRANNIKINTNTDSNYYNSNPYTNKNSDIKINKNNHNHNYNIMSKHKTFINNPKKKNNLALSSITNILSKINNIKNEKMGENIMTNDKNIKPKETKSKKNYKNNNINNNMNNNKINNANNNITSSNNITSQINSRNNYSEKILYNQDDIKNSLPLTNLNECSMGSIKTIMSNTENDFTEIKEAIKEYNNFGNNKNNNFKSKIYGNKINFNKNAKKEEYPNKLNIYINKEINEDAKDDDFFSEKIKEEDNIDINKNTQNDNQEEDFCLTHYTQKIIYFCINCNLKYCIKCLEDISHDENHQIIKYPTEYDKEFYQIINEYILNIKNGQKIENYISYYEQKINLYQKEKDIFLKNIELFKNNYINKINSKIEDIKNIMNKIIEKNNYINKYNILLKEYLDIYNKNINEFKNEKKKIEITKEINTYDNHINDVILEKEKNKLEIYTVNTLFQYISSRYIENNLVNIKEKRSNALYTEIKFDINCLKNFLKNIFLKSKEKMRNSNEINNSEENIEGIISDKELYLDENLLSLTNASFYFKNINENALLQLNINLNKNENSYDNNINYNNILAYILLCQKEENIFELSNKKVINGILTMYKLIPWNKISDNDIIKFKIVLVNNI